MRKKGGRPCSFLPRPSVAATSRSQPKEREGMERPLPIFKSTCRSNRVVNYSGNYVHTMSKLNANKTGPSFELLLSSIPALKQSQSKVKISRYILAKCVSLSSLQFAAVPPDALPLSSSFPGTRSLQVPPLPLLSVPLLFSSTTSYKKEGYVGAVSSTVPQQQATFFIQTERPKVLWSWNTFLC